MDDLIGAYEELPYPIWRRAGEDTMRLGKARNYVPMLLEVDVTEARAALALRKQQGGPEISFTAWAVKCIAQAAAQHRRVHALRRRGLAELARPGRLVLFHDVDVSVVAFRRLEGDEQGERIPMPFVVRKVNEKGLEELAAEIQQLQSRPLSPEGQWLDDLEDMPPAWLMKLAMLAPHQVRDWLYWNRLLGDPMRVKKTMGTVMVTSMPLSMKSGGAAWGIPVGLHPLLVALGAIGRRPGLTGDQVEPRDVLSMTVLFDHDVVDGMPVALFLRRLTDLMGGAWGL